MSVFLSASVPDPRRDPKYFQTGRIARIREAITQLARVTLPAQELVFGGHPAISPLVLAVANQLGELDRVVIYQSEFFRNVIPKESLAFSHLLWTPEVPGRREKSLATMRNAMIGDRDYVAAFFIGGMEGVEEELQLFKGKHPQVPTYPIASTGAAAARLLANGEGPQDPQIRHALQHELVYAYLFQVLFGQAP